MPKNNKNKGLPIDAVKCWTENGEVHYCTKDDKHYRLLPDGRKYLVNFKDVLKLPSL